MKHDKYSWLAAVVKDRRLKDSEALTLIALSVYANSKGMDNAHPGRKRLGEDRRISVRTVERHLEAGELFGWIARTSRGSTSPRRKFADVYKLTFSESANDNGEWPTSRHLDVEWSNTDQSTNVEASLSSPWDFPNTDQSTKPHDQSTKPHDQSTPRCRPTQVVTPSPKSKCSESDDSASTSSASTPSRATGDEYAPFDAVIVLWSNWTSGHGDFDSLTEAIEEVLEIWLEGSEMNTVEAMLQNDQHPFAVMNKILADRGLPTSPWLKRKRA